MKLRLSPLHYPVVIKQHLDFIVLSVPDLGISVVENAPLQGKLNPEYVLKIATALANVWLKVQKRLLEHKSAGKSAPSPSKQKMSVDARRLQYMTASEVAKRLGVSRMTVHRLVKKGLLTCTRTRGRHSRFSELNLKAYEKKYCIKNE